MSFNANLPLDELQQLRMAVGDLDPEYPILPDEVYQHLLIKYTNNIKRASLDAARTILFYLTRYTRERTGSIEVYGAEWATNYRKALELMLRDPNISFIDPIPYAGGISRNDVQANRDNTDAKNPWSGSLLCECDEITSLQF